MYMMMDMNQINVLNPMNLALKLKKKHQIIHHQQHSDRQKIQNDRQNDRQIVMFLKPYQKELTVLKKKQKKDKKNVLV